uniref:tyrosine-type recombinase/integrase n=1 Tax=Megamonas hypermegale TaxID=158847 RepID=UPI0032EADDE3
MFEEIKNTGIQISNDIDIKNSLVRIFGKGSKERIVPLNDYATEALNNYILYHISIIKIFLNYISCRIYHLIPLKTDFYCFSI